MRNIVISDLNKVRDNLLPLTYTRPVAALRVGIDTLADKWQAFLPGAYYYEPEAEYLNEIFGCVPSELAGAPDTVRVAANVIADAGIAAAVAALVPGQRLVCNGVVLACCGDGSVDLPYDGDVTAVNELYDIFLSNGKALAADFSRIVAGRQSQPLSATNTVIGDPSLIFVEQGACVEGAFINTTGGPVYIGPDAEVMEGSMLRGPLALCCHATVNMGTKIYSGTTVGPWCKVGGEINNVVFQAYSNKAHDGFLGNAVIGEWCNIGAGAVASNLKNDYTPIRLWNYPTGRFLRTQLQFCGLIMGDHCKAGINTMFNTATVLGVGVNIHGSGFPRNFVPSFSEGSTAGYSDVSMSKFLQIASRMMARRGVELTPAHERMFMAIRKSAEEFK